jgi:hypothetical protein
MRAASVGLEAQCYLCPELVQLAAPLPAGWECIGRPADLAARAFCPAHAAVGEFMARQCNGCRETWPDCRLWRAAHARRRDRLKPDELDALRAGTCPRRRLAGAQIEMDWPTPIAGTVLAQAFEDIWREREARAEGVPEAEDDAAA